MMVLLMESRVDGVMLVYRRVWTIYLLLALAHRSKDSVGLET